MPVTMRFICFNREYYHKDFEMIDDETKGECCVCMEGANVKLLKTEGHNDYLYALLNVSKMQLQDLISNYICKSCLRQVIAAHYFDMECVVANRILGSQMCKANNNNS